MGHILVVEDDPQLARLLARILRTKGFEVSAASSGSAGLRAALNRDPDLILLDLMLPDIRGEDVLVELMTTRPESRVLVLSAITQIAVRVGVLGCGAVDYMAKPFATAELLARIRLRIRADRRPEPPLVRRERQLREVDPLPGRRDITLDERDVELRDRAFVPPT